jgi:OHCU decarboxylase
VPELYGGILNLQQLNTLSEVEAEAEFLKCCGSQSWARLMVASRPFKNVDELTAKAGVIWWALDQDDWLEAFRSHPKIGEKKAEATISIQSQAWSAQEQSGVNKAAAPTIAALNGLNREYLDKFGFIFIVCATGKSSDEMLAILKSRLGNDPEKELRIAAGEQAKITELRLKKLVD